MARIYTQRTRKQRTCGRCGDTIHIGEVYRSAAPGFRGNTLIRCMKPGCSFRQSELTTSNLSEAYAAQEDAEGELETIVPEDVAPEDLEGEIQPILDACAERIREVASQYREASESWAGGNQPNEEWEEKADELESAADEIEQFDVEEFDPDGDEPKEEWVTRIVDEATSHIQEVSMP